MPRPKLHATRHDLPQEVREKAIAQLNQHLADSFDLFSQIKQAHWNVKGLQFHQLHLLFDTLAESTEEYIDTIAERTTALGGSAMGTVRMSAAASRLPEYPTDALDGRQHVEALAERFAALGASVRAAIGAAEEFGDVDTADLFTQISRGLDQHLWFLEAHVQG